jgi:hypothetical protein
MRTSILDFVAEDAARLSNRMDAGDRIKIAEYLDSVRDIERRIQKAEQSDSQFALLGNVGTPAGIPDDFHEHSRLMIDLQIMAMQADLTRVATFMIGREASARSFPDIGVPEAHHPLSHHGNDPAKMARLADVNKVHMDHFAYYLKRMIETKDGASSMLDTTLVLAGPSLGDPNRHDHVDVPLLVAGGLTPGNRHVRLAKGTPMTNILVSAMETLGVKQQKFGDSTGPLREFSA